MATWIGHLRIAERLLAEIPDLDAGYFGIGSLAPDSGVPDEKFEVFDPPTEVTHFKVGGSRRGNAIQDLAFLRKYEAELAPSYADRSEHSFLMGYFFHLVTDHLWDVDVVVPGRAGLPAELRYDKEFARKVKSDWYGQDFIYLRDHPRALFWRVYLDAEYEHDYLGFLPAAAFRRQMDFLKGLYQPDDEEIRRNYTRDFPYTNKQQMDAALASVGDKTIAIYHRIWTDGVTLDGLGSAVKLLKA